MSIVNEKSKRLFRACCRRAGAASLGDAEKLIGEGADVNVRCGGLEFTLDGVTLISSLRDENLSALFMASCRGHLDLVRLLLANGAVDENALYAAVVECWFAHEEMAELARDKLEVARFLLGRGFDARFKTAWGTTLLEAAVMSGCVEMAELLLENGARLEDCSLPPLLIVARLVYHYHPYYDPEHVGDAEGYSSDSEDDAEPVVQVLEDLVPEGHEDEGQVQEGQGQEGQGQEAHGQEGQVLDSDSDADEELRFYTTRLFPPGLHSLSAPRKSRLTGMVRLLLAHGADPDVFEDDGRSLLEVAAQRGFDQMIDLLLDHQRPYLPDYNDDKDEDVEEDGDAGEEVKESGEDGESVEQDGESTEQDNDKKD